MRFITDADDGYRVYLDDELVMERWNNGTGSNASEDVLVSAGEHTVVVEYYEDGGFAYLFFDFEELEPLTGTGTEEDPWQVTQCLTIFESGYYELQNNITDVVGDCILIEADDVFFNGGEFTISSDGLQENTGIFSEGYNSINISLVTVEGFYDGIMLYDSEDSEISYVTVRDSGDDGIDLHGVVGMTISNSTITGSEDDGIEVREYDNEIDTFIASENITLSGIDINNTYDSGIEGYSVQGFTITDVVITGVNDGDGIYMRGSYNPYMDTDVNNITILIDNVTISDVSDDQGIDIQGAEGVTITNSTIANIYNNGISLEDVSDVVISNNAISDSEDADGITMYYVTTATISGNDISSVASDGIYVADGVDVTITDNIISNTVSDGIDISYDDDENNNITITNNIMTNIGDNGIELDEVYGATITGNNMEIAGDGIAVDDSEDIEFNNNTITPTTEAYLAIPEHEFTLLVLDVENAEESISDSDDSSFTYALPFTFNFMGRDITDITVSTNGAIELLEDEEDCEICSSYGNYAEYLIHDVIFTSFDDLVVYDGHVSVYYLDDEDGERVVVEFYGLNINDEDIENNLMHIQTILYPNGTIEWNFNEMAFENYGYEMFTGVYASEEGILYQAGRVIDESGVGYAGDFSGEGEFELVEGYNENIGLDLDNVADSSFIGNSIHASQWVYAEGLENVSFNDNDSGNTYYLLNGDGAWTLFDITDSTGNGFADSGTNRPFNEDMLGVEYWEGEGEDEYPATILRQSVARRTSSGGSIASRVKNLKDMGKDEDAEKLEKEFKQMFEKETPTIESLMKRVAELQALLAQLQGQPTSSIDTTPLVCSPLLRQGTRSEEVRKLQQKLNVQPQSGFFGPLTAQAVRAFQTEKGIRVDGIVGPETCAMFN